VSGKIAHIITGLNDGGAEAVLYRLCVYDDVNEHIVISLMDEGKYGAMLREAGIDVHCLNMHSGMLSLSGIILLWKLIRSYNPYAVQTWMYHADLVGGIIAKLAGVKNIVWGVHNTLLVPGKSKRKTIFVAKLNAFLSKYVPNEIVYCAHKSREVQEAIGYYSQKGIVIPNGYDIGNFIPNVVGAENIRNLIGVSNSINLLGIVGRFDPLKDHQNLIKAIGLLKQSGIEFKCVFVGTKLTQNNGLIIKWLTETGVVNNAILLGQRTDVPHLMNAFDLHILSSSSEAFPNVLPEAMACGTPCVSTNVGDSSLIVGDTGWMVEPGNPEELARAIMSALYEKENNPYKWKNRKIACRERIVENFSIERMVEKYNATWK